jgi:hypothetical protein
MVDPNRVITLVLDQKFMAFLDAVHKQHQPKIASIRQRLLSLDPGGTTGHATFDGDKTIKVWQVDTNNIPEAFDGLVGIIKEFQPDHLRYEDYRVYEWKSEDHAWSPVHTLRWIGAIQVACHVTDTSNSCLMAANPKKFWTDDKLNLFGLNPKGLRHGRDALRHLLYYLLFPTK